MQLHIPTILVLSIITDLLLVLILLHTWRTRTTYSGFIFWIAGTACWSLGSFLNMMLANIQPLFIPRVIGALLLLLHPLLLYEGLSRFYGFKRGVLGTPLNAALVTLQMLLCLYWNYVVDDYALRAGSLSLVMALLFGRIAVEPLMWPVSRRYSMQRLISVILLPLIAMLTLRAILHFVGASSTTNFATALTGESLLRNLLLYSFVVELIICYSYISLTSNRVERELDESRLAAEKASKAQIAFLKIVSHELRTPLATISNAAELLTERTETGDRDALLSLLRQAAARQKHLIEDMLDLAAIEADRMKINPAPFSLAEFLNEITTLYLPRSAAHGLSFTPLWADNLPEWVVGDRMRITQILSNLLDNAIKHTPAGGIITVNAQLVDGQQPAVLRFDITDTGCGIPLDQQEEIFAPFVSLNSATSGLGLGLSICSRLAVAMNGSIGVESAPGQGSRFNFTFPYLSAPPDEQNEQKESLFAGKVLHGTSRVLAVDDTPENLQLLVLILQTMPVHLVTASSGKEAIELLGRQYFDVVLTDMNMPDMDGLTLVRLIRSSEQQQQGEQPVRIIGISANAYPEDISAALNAGCDSYLSRPFTVSALLHELLPAAPEAAEKLNTLQDEQLRQLQEQARTRISDSAAIIAAALAAGDSHIVREEGHRIKGLGMMFHLEEAERIGDELERAGRQGALEGAVGLIAKLQTSSAFKK